ncbi:MAG: competence type IV pilus minor pilin ComGG [Bacillaceae bacterium]
MRNERGFIFPLTCCFVFLIFTLVMHNVSVYISEVRFYQEVKESYRIENLLTLGIYEAKQLLENPTISVPYQETKQYPHGKVQIVLTVLTAEKTKVELKCDSGEDRIRTGVYYYHKVDKKLYIL